MTHPEKIRAISISLPWPAKDLLPNARPHWARKAKAVKKARTDAWALALEAGARSLSGDAMDVSLEFLPPDKRRRDTDGMISAAKASLDGIADALGIDDSRFNLSFRRGDVVPGGCIRVEVAPAGGQP